MPYIRYEFDLNEPNGRKQAVGKTNANYFRGWIFTLLLFIGIGYFIYSSVSLFKGNFSMEFICSAGLLVLVSIIDFFILFSGVDRKIKTKIATKYFLFFWGGALVLCGMMAVIVSIHALCNGVNRMALLICSVLSVVIVTLVVIFIYRKMDGHTIRLFTDRKYIDDFSDINEALPTISRENQGCIFCHKCGKQLLGDSVYCASCGTKLK